MRTFWREGTWTACNTTPRRRLSWQPRTRKRKNADIRRDESLPRCVNLDVLAIQWGASQGCGRHTLHTYIHASIYIHMNAYIYIYTCHVPQRLLRTYIYTFIDTFPRFFLRGYIQTYIHTHINAYINTYTDTVIHTYMRTCKNTYMSSKAVAGPF
jgi:hypothetical protein